MEEHEYYNLYASAGRGASEAKHAANTYTLRLMIEHLYFVHKMGIREVAHTLRYQEKKVKEIIKRAQIDYEAYNSRKKHNKELA